MKKTKKVSTVPDSNKKLAELSNNRTYEDIINDNGCSMFPESTAWIKRLAYTIMKWADESDDLMITEFCIKYKISRSTLYDYRERHPEIRRAMDHALTSLGARRMSGAIKKQYDKEIILKEAHRYDPEWHEINVYHAKLKRDEQQSGTQVVILEKFPDVETD